MSIDDEFEYEFFEKRFASSKEAKIEKKRRISGDKSKYKKTDQKQKTDSETVQRESFLARDDLLQGRVLSILSQDIFVDHEGTTFKCVLKGILKKERTRQMSLITVGDFVFFEVIDNHDGAIAHIEPRKSILSRADNINQRKEQIIAANIDQVLITASVGIPALNPPLIDRYIIAAQMGNMEPVIIVNKIDLLTHSGMEVESVLYQELLRAYATAKIPVIGVSAKTGEGMDALKAAMKDKASVFSGQSGTGKSSLINSVTGLDFAVGEPIKKTGKGSHTTTTAHLVRLDCGGWCIDTPGIRSFGLWDLNLDQIKEYFSEIFEAGHHCKFSDCSHTHEENCAVARAVEDGTISPLRYNSYVSLVATIQEEHKRR